MRVFILRRRLARFLHHALIVDGGWIAALQVVSGNLQIQKAGCFAVGINANTHHSARLLRQSGAVKTGALGLWQRNRATGSKH